MNEKPATGTPWNSSGKTVNNSREDSRESLARSCTLTHHDDQKTNTWEVSTAVAQGPGDMVAGDCG